MDFTFPAAFAPLFTDTASVTGTRRETGASVSRSLALTVPCCVLGGDQGEGANASGSQEQAAVEWTVLIRRADWPDHKPPQAGDAVAIDDYPAFHVLTSQPYGPDTWSLLCRTRGAQL
jgi:hypothetical protein